MKRKLTEEEYLIIVDSYKKANGLDKNNFFLAKKQTAVIKEAWDIATDKIDRSLWDSEREVIAIMNPVTREGAHGKFVEKEKKYRWKYKKTDVDGDYHYLSRISGLIELSYSIGPAHLTEKQVIEAGYNPDMFDREEVD